MGDVFKLTMIACYFVMSFFICISVVYVIYDKDLHEIVDFVKGILTKRNAFGKLCVIIVGLLFLPSIIGGIIISILIILGIALFTSIYNLGLKKDDELDVEEEG